jgi:putative lipoprotein (rSAM/lipoprotein system)
MKYGDPAAEYEVRGIVADNETSKPIQNIKVVSTNGYTMYTDTEGKYAVHDISYGTGAFDSQVKFEDIDGEENDGDFETQEIDVKFTKADRLKRGKPEKYVKIQNIKLEHKK